MSWFCNYQTPAESEERARKLNRLARKGNAFLHCSFYRYFAGPPAMVQPGECTTMGGLHRKPLAACAHCGRPVKDHNYRSPHSPCGW